MAAAARTRKDKTILSILGETDALLDGPARGAHGRMILIHKTKSRDLEARFRTVPVEIDGGLTEEFKDRARLALEDIKANADSITDFSDPANARSYVAMDAGLLPDLGTLLKKLEAEAGFNTTHDFDEVREKGISCFVLKSPEQRRVFVFFNVGKNHLKPDKYVVTKFDGETLRPHRDKLVVFENRAFAVYYEEIGKILMISYKQTKRLLNFDERFREKCRDILAGGLGDLVALEGTDVASVLSDRSINERMVKMESRGAFAGADPGIFEAWNEFFRETPLEGTGPISLDGEGRAIVGKPADLEMPLRVLAGDIVEEVIPRGRYAMATGKRELRVSGAGRPRLSRRSAQLAS